MESRAPPKKSEGQSNEDSQPAQRKQIVEKAADTNFTKSSDDSKNAPSNSRKEDSAEKADDSVLREISTSISKLDLEMRNQISSARGMTVEINTLRDLMPKLRKEIHTYTVNECQLIKELEKKLPSCQEHKDIRLNLVLDEIQRLRINRSRTLTRLKESIVKVTELQSRMEVASYDAGEIFWDRMISRITESKFQKLDRYTQCIENSDGNAVPVIFNNYIHQNKLIPAATDRDSIPLAGNNNEEGLMTQLSIAVKDEIAEHKENLFDHSKSGHHSAIVTPSSANKTNSKGELAMTSAVPDSETRTFRTQLQDSDINIEKVIAEARKSVEPSSVSKRTALLIIAPIATVVGLLIIDKITGILSKSLFGG